MRGVDAARSVSRVQPMRPSATIRCTSNVRENLRIALDCAERVRSVDRSFRQRWRVRGSGTERVRPACMPRGHDACRDCVDGPNRSGAARARAAGMQPGQRAHEARWGGNLDRHPLWRHWTQVGVFGARVQLLELASARSGYSGPEIFARGSFLLALPLRAAAAASRGDAARSSAVALHHRWPGLMPDRHFDAACEAKL